MTEQGEMLKILNMTIIKEEEFAQEMWLHMVSHITFLKDTRDCLEQDINDQLEEQFKQEKERETQNGR